MNNFKRIFDAMYHIDLESNSIEKREIEEGDLDEYIVDLLSNIVNLPESRHFSFESENTEIRVLVEKIISEYIEGLEDNPNYITYFDNIANRLLRKEIDAQEKYGHFTKLQKGSLIQSLVEFEEELFLLISKVEHESFLNTEDLVKQIGLPFEKKALKICLIKFTEDNDIGDIIVSDSNVKISQYWVKDFLELKEKNSDERNTLIAFNSIDLILTRKLKRQSPSDYTILRNSLIGYFKSQEEFSFDNMLNTVFGQYEPEKPEVVNIDSIKELIAKLPEEKGFDKRFSVISKEIKARIKKIVKISDKIELNLKDHIEQLKHIIKSKELPNGEKVITIKTDNQEAFEMFNYRE